MNRRLLVCSLGPFLAGLSACVSLERPPADKRRYLLEAARPEAAAPAGDRVLCVPTFHVVSPWAGAGFTRRLPNGVVAVDFDAEFLVPPGTALAEAARRWLAAAGVFGAVVGEGSRALITHWLEADVLELSIDQRAEASPYAVLEIDFLLLDRERRIVRRARLSQRIPMADALPATAVEAWGRGLARILAALEQKLEG